MFRNWLFMKVTAIILILVMISTPVIFAQQLEGTFLEGKMDGQSAARGNALWILAGAGCGIFGVGAAYFNKPAPPAYALVGKSPEYVLGYTEGYQNKARNTNVGYACGGWAAFILIYAAAGGFSTSETTE
ncbi:hypothetical protein JXJ21_14110 [candidate division KSB1 bacterium]|nr:hypothetical protein [candidate division KSB1 bacterium]